MKNLLSAIEEWVADHPYLAEVGKLERLVASVLEEHKPAVNLEETVTNWNDLAKEMQRGIPALQGAVWQETVIQKAGALLEQMTAALAAADLPQGLQEQSRKIERLFKDRPELACRLVQEALADRHDWVREMEQAQVDPGTMTFLLWSVLPAVLEPLIRQVQDWQKEGRWEKAYCPVCGQLPAMAQLVRTGKGRERELVCGRCQTRWHYRRLGCPYCECEDYKTLEIIEPEGVPDLRIDTCHNCKGYLKTYTGEGNEQVVLADWSTLHFDVIGKNKGFQRVGFQRYQI